MLGNNNIVTVKRLLLLKNYYPKINIKQLVRVQLIRSEILHYLESLSHRLYRFTL